MKQHRTNDQSRNVPRGVRLISQVGVVGGMIALMISIVFALIINHIWRYQIENVGARALLAFSMIFIVISFVVGFTGLLTILSSFSLRKMKRSGFWLAYFLIVAWLLIGGVMLLVSILSISGGRFIFGLITAVISVAIMGVAIAAGVDLYRVRSHFAKSPN
ncbi:MAG: hypothetical protein RLZZ511_2151 [Cyanobacteriota bacterium]|jgi:hypothetical protein